MGTMQFRNPQARSSALTTLRTLQPRALGFLNRVVPLVSVSNSYVVATVKQTVATSFDQWIRIFTATLIRCMLCSWIYMYIHVRIYLPYLCIH